VGKCNNVLVVILVLFVQLRDYSSEAHSVPID
jgi:hypothetical protein